MINSGILAVSAESLSTEQRLGVKPLKEPGDYYQHIFTNGRLRSYWVHIPPSYKDGTPVPLVFVLHGSGIGANSFSTKAYGDMDEKADEEGFIAVYPNGELLRFSNYFKHPISYLWDIYALLKISREWNRWDDNNVDDVGFIRNLINRLENKLNVDSSRIYVMGVSGGAMMTYRLGAELSDRIAAIAPIAGSIGGIGFVPEKDNSLTPYIIPPPINPLPVITFHGLQDVSVPYNGGWKRVFTWGSDNLWAYIVSVNESVSFWIEQNNCNPIPQVETSDNGKIISHTYRDGSDNSEVVLVTYVEGGHEWFKSPPHEDSAIDLMWEFFEQHSK
jgi:polyhydroxybutyrate depolymerase